MVKFSSLRGVEPTPAYMSDADILRDLGKSSMWLNRARRAGIYPLPVKFCAGGRNNTPRHEHEDFKARHAVAPRTLGRRPGQPRRDPPELRQPDIEGLVAPASASPAETNPTLKR
jgi:hypothetical protein